MDEKKEIKMAKNKEKKVRKKKESQQFFNLYFYRETRRDIKQ